MVHPPTLKQLRYLSAVNETRHFGNAAKACHVSQSTLSAGIHELEVALGVTLVERNNKQVLLTPMGETVILISRDVFDNIDKIMGLCDASKAPFCNDLRIGVIPTVAPFMLPKLLKRLRQKYPQFRVFIREDVSKNLVSALQRGELDMLLMALPFPADNCEAQHLFYDEFHLAYPKGHDLAKKDRLLTRDVRKADLLLLEDGHCLRDHAIEACHLDSKDLSIPYQATTLNTVVQMVANGIGVTLLPQMACSANILRGTGVESRCFDEKNISRSIGLLWRKNSSRVEEFKVIGVFIQQLFV